MRTRKLFVSFTGLLYALQQKKVSQADLDNGIFYFSCIREHAVEPWGSSYNELNNFQREDGSVDSDAAATAHRLVIAAITKAEREGRIAWRQDRETPNTFRQLNDLLAANGFATIMSDAETRRGSEEEYTTGKVRNRVAHAGLPLVVVL